MKMTSPTIVYHELFPMLLNGKMEKISSTILRHEPFLMSLYINGATTMVRWK